MTAIPRREVLLTRPAQGDDVVLQVDGSPVANVDLPGVRAFLGDWKVAATRVQDAPAPSFATAEAVLIEVPSHELDDIGRVVPIAVWLAAAQADASALNRVQTFAAPLGRTFDMRVAGRSLDAAVTAQGRLRAQAGGRSRGWFRRLMAPRSDRRHSGRPR